MSEDRSDRRIRGETHIYRINNWAGSDSYVEGSRRDPEDFDPVPDQPKLPYRLLMNAYHDDVMHYGGDIVYLWPHQVGSHHAMIEGVEYPDEAKPPAPEEERHVPQMSEALADILAKKDMQLEEANVRIAALEAQVNAAKAPPPPTPAQPAAAKPVEAPKPPEPAAKPAEVAPKPEDAAKK